MENSLHKAKRPLISTIESARHSISRAQTNLQHMPTNLDIGYDPVSVTKIPETLSIFILKHIFLKASLQWKENMIDVNRQNVTSHLSAMNAATAQIVTLTANGPQNSDYNAVGAAVSCM